MKKFKTLFILLSITAILFVTSSVLNPRRAEARDVTDTRYEVFFLGASPACSATTLAFRPDQVLVFECVDGYGLYDAFLDSFTASFWASDFYLGQGAVLLLTGIALDPLIVGVGISVIGNDVGLVLFSGYLLSAP